MTRRGNGEGSIYRYRNGFAAHLWITTPEGRRQRKSVYGKSREVVHEKWLRLHERARRGPVAPTSPTLGTFVQGWLRDVVRPGLAPATAANYELFCRLYIVPDLGAKRLDRLTVRDVQTWLNALRSRCQCCAQGKDAGRDGARCCAAGQCCAQVGSEWTFASGVDSSAQRVECGHALITGGAERRGLGTCCGSAFAAAGSLEC